MIAWLMVSISVYDDPQLSINFPSIFHLFSEVENVETPDHLSLRVPLETTSKWLRLTGPTLTAAGATSLDGGRCYGWRWEPLDTDHIVSVMG